MGTIIDDLPWKDCYIDCELVRERRHIDVNADSKPRISSLKFKRSRAGMFDIKVVTVIVVLKKLFYKKYF